MADPTMDLTVRLLKDLAGCPDPRVALAQTAQRFNMPAARVRELTSKYGWPNPASMAKAATVLERQPDGARAGTVTVPPPPVETLTQSLRLADLAGHPSNPPERTDDVAELAASIKQVGQLQPLVVTEHPNQKGWLILDGHRRATALRSIGRTRADCTIRPSAGQDLDEQLFVMLIANIHRQDLTAMEKAYAFGDLRDRRGMTMLQIAARAGLSAGTVSYYLSLLELDTSTQVKVQTGEVQITQAINAVKQVRRQTRRVRGEKPAGRPVVIEPFWFGKRHVLARKVSEACTHSARPRIGDVGCGQCWEDAIRADERVSDEAVGA